MKPFPVIAAMFLTLGSVISFLIGVWIFLAKIFTTFPHLELFFLVFVGNFLVFLGAIYWGFCFFEPRILVLEKGLKKDKHYFVSGGIIFLWACISLFIGCVGSIKSGYFLEAIGFIGVFACDRYFQRRGFLPSGYYRFKIIISFFTLMGLLGAFFSP